MSKRKNSEFENCALERKVLKKHVEQSKKHSLDSDEEDDNVDTENILDENDIEGEEDGIASSYGDIQITAFNMREEMEEGHFDKDGHFIWNNDKEISDHWLDNINWVKIKERVPKKSSGDKGLGDDSDSDIEEEPFEEIQVYKQIIVYLKPLETINKALQRLGGETKKLSSLERLKRKKAGTLNSNNDVIQLTELANKILTQTGNMDVYQETYENILQKVNKYEHKNKSNAPAQETELDMYADDFDVKEKQKLNDALAGPSNITDPNITPNSNAVMWEFKRQQEKDNMEGPYSTQQMITWVNEGRFKPSVWVRKCGEHNFYSSDRMDFELYI